MNWPMTSPENLEAAPFEEKCPTCNTIDFHRLIERVDQRLHIPPRYALICAKCHTPFYVLAEKHENTD